MREIIEELPEEQCATICMFYYEEMPVKEIASTMDVPESAVKSLLPPIGPATRRSPSSSPSPKISVSLIYKKN